MNRSIGIFGIAAVLGAGLVGLAAPAAMAEPGTSGIVHCSGSADVSCSILLDPHPDLAILGSYECRNVRGYANYRITRSQKVSGNGGVEWLVGYFCS